MHTFRTTSLVSIAWLVGCSSPHYQPTAIGQPSTAHDRHGLPPIQPIPGRRISHDERWSISFPRARTELEGTTFGEQEIREFWTRKGWRLTQREERYFAEVEALEQQGLLTQITLWSACPYTAVYQTLDRVRVLDIVIERGHEFILELDDDDDHLKIAEPRFSRTSTYVEDHEGGHGPAAER